MLGIGLAVCPAPHAMGRGGPDRQDPDPETRIDWDTVAANLAIMLLQQGYLAPAGLKEHSAVSVAVVGDDRFGKAFTVLAAQKKIERPVEATLRVVQVTERDLSEKNVTLRQCHVVILATSSRQVHEQVIRALDRSPTLLVGRLPGFITMGGHVQLWLAEGNKPRFELDLKAMRKHGIGVSKEAAAQSQPAPVGVR